MSLTKRKLLDDLNAELERHEDCEVEIFEGQDWDEGISFLFAECKTHKEPLSDEATQWYANERRLA